MSNLSKIKISYSKMYLALSLLTISVFTLNAQTGIIWNQPIEVASSMYDNAHPRIAVDRAGNPLILWGNSTSNQCNFSRWNGMSFTTPVTINPMAIPVFSFSWAGPDIASKGDTIYIVIKQTPEDTHPIFLVSSFDGGQTFNSPVQVDFITPYFSRFPTVTIDPNGNPIIAFIKFDPNFLNARWVVSRSNDFGNTFTSDTLASGWSGGTVCDCCPGAITSSDNNVAMMYRDNLNNIRDTWVGISNDNGNSFSSGINIDQNNWMIMACPSTGPDGVIIGDSLYSVFMNEASGDPKVYFSATNLLTNQSSGGDPLSASIDQNYPRINNSENSLAVVWKEKVGSANKALLRFTEDINSGLNSSVDTVAMSDVVNVDVALFDGSIYTVWEDASSGTIKFRSGSYSSTSGVPDISNEIIVNIFPNPSNDDEITISVGQKITIASYSILDLYGQVVMKGNLKFNSGLTKIKTELVPGIYYLHLDSEGRQYFNTIVKL